MGKSTSGKTTKPAASKAAKKNTGAFQISKEPVVRSKEDLDVHKYELTQGEEPVSPAAEQPAFEQLGELPQSYGATTLYLVARDPHWLFSYWDLDWAAYPASEMQDGARRFFLKLYTEEDGEEFATEINPEAKNWYLPVNKPGSTYYAELGFNGKDGAWTSIVQSDRASAPRDVVVAEEAETTFATVPLHLTFQRLLEMVRNTMNEGETLIQALSRLQAEGRKLAFAPGTVPNWTDEQRQILTALFGKDLVERIGMGSGEIDQLLRKELEEKLSTESASEIMAKARELGAPGESSLFSGVGAFSSGLGAFSSGLFAGLQLGALGAWGSEVSSWLSGLGLGAWGSEVTSWWAGLGGAAGAFGGSSGAWSSEVTSWSSALGSSWSAQPFSEERPREFFMHVNAEVIFYGGTHPDAKVTIDGKPITLNPDGTFRYHFRFPNGNYEIPVVAESPDGVEQRSAALTFRRATSRKGEVGNTAQPEYLEAPMGQQA